MILNSSRYKFLKATDVKNGDTLIIKNAGAVQESQKFTVELEDGTKVPKKQYVFEVELGGEMRTLTMNKMSRDNLAAVLGNDTEKWIDKKASIELCLFSNGKRGIVLTPVNGTPLAAPKGTLGEELKHDGADEAPF